MDTNRQRDSNEVPESAGGRLTRWSWLHLPTALRLSREHKGGDAIEREQAVIRVILGSIVVIYMFTAGTGAASVSVVGAVRWVGGMFLLAAVVLLLAALRDIGPAQARRSLGILVDLSGASAMMALAGEAGAPLLGIYLWVIVGNGFRYNIRYLAFATVMSLIGFALVVVVAPYWHHHPVFALSYFLVLMVIPAYVAALLATLHRAVREAKEASSAKSRFLAKMSHELRTPLNGVIGLSDLLMDAELRGQERELVRTIHVSGKTLLGIIDNILDFSKIEAGRLSVDCTDLDIYRLVSETVAMFAPQAWRQGIELDTELDPQLPHRLRGDPLHIRQVLMNLVGNAVKFTESGGVVVRVMQADDPQVPALLRLRFEVEDTGMGIAPKDQQHIFDSFQQATDIASRRFGGTGLGTAIARELVRLMDGQIGFHSILGQGSLFWFELPLERSQAVAEGAVPAPDQSAQLLAANVVPLAAPQRSLLPVSGLRVLVAEDNEINRQVLRATLERAGCRLIMVQDGEQALNALHEHGDELDLLLLDKNMPGRGGLEVFRAQRFMRSRAPVPTIILSADATDAALQSARATGVDAYLTKPLDRQRLLDTIAAIALRGGRAPAGADAPTPVESSALTDGACARGPAPDAGAGKSEPFLDQHKLASLRQLDGGSGFFVELLEGFQRDAETSVSAIAEALADGDYPRMRHAVHALLGSAGEVGALRLVSDAQKFRGLRPFELDSAPAQQLLARLRQTLATTLRLLRAPERSVPADWVP